MIYNIWQEGFMIQGMDMPAKAEFVTTVEAASFQDACDKFYFGNLLYDSRTLSVWGVDYSRQKKKQGNRSVKKNFEF